MMDGTQAMRIVNMKQNTIEKRLRFDDYMRFITNFNVLETISHFFIYVKSSIHCMQTIRFTECSSPINNNEAENCS